MTDGHKIRVEVPMRWGDMDAYGHINNVNLVRMMEEARIAGFGVPGGTGKPGIEPQIDLFSTVPPNTQILVVEHRVRYIKPLDYRNVPAHVDLWISNIKGASFDICYEFHDPVDGGVCVRAATTLAFFSVETQRLLRLSAEHKESLGAFSADPIFK
ncbi:4-hydroxybenzoyl-CoA thioesterase [Arthrobacter sp. MYb227]|uniref:acyl-CoA thioesterase n=1 Tax=Arthrobacter sp. MYb227 TaxID=1848601 RepID=UPI000CFB97F6|nr:thioesterase family protein [Arthrobacter sp. MYb227]PQZ91548.1 4-hydroxybenzoyl-CoA thioesterase [Arthrobacter sp. MYb227]